MVDTNISIFEIPLFPKTKIWILFECLTLATREKQEMLGEFQNYQGHLESNDVDICHVQLVGE